MHISDIIYKKRNNLKLLPEEISFAVSSYTTGEIPDYQMSAFLMAAFIRGLDEEEVSALTRAMIDSGETADLSDIAGAKVDKHSTGGVGDGISLVLAPLAASAGVVVPMMSGRSLGHTGGTLDKLESIPGFRTRLDISEYKSQLKKIGVAMIGQTDMVCPADKKLYALRDATSTVDCIGLIAASIMSKKLAEGCDALLLDVKAGSGAFMKSVGGARSLAKAMISIGKNLGLDTQALITDMNQPLGRAIGNAMEVRQAVEVLQGGGPSDFIELTLELGSRMLLLGRIEKDKKKARELLIKQLKNGNALNKFKQLIEHQGGEPSFIDNLESVVTPAENRMDILSPGEGYISYIDTYSIGMAAVLLGAGRRQKEDSIDYSAGIMIHKKYGVRVEKNEPLATFYYNRLQYLDEAKELFLKAYHIEESKPEPLKLIYEEL